MNLFLYKAKVIDVYDGDTCTCIVDLGFKLSIKIKVRLLGIDTPEIRTRDLEEKKKGYASKEWLSNKILDKDIFIHTKEKGKFGRWLCYIWLPDDEKTIENSLNNKIIKEGHAKEYFGGKRK